MTKLSARGLATEVEEAEERIREATGVDPKPFFRCPYGEGHDDARVVETLTAHSYRLVGWHVDPQDWNDELTAVDVVTALQAGLALTSESSPIVLLHTWPAWTSAVVKQVVEEYPDDEIVWAPLQKPVG